MLCFLAFFKFHISNLFIPFFKIFYSLKTFEMLFADFRTLCHFFRSLVVWVFIVLLLQLYNFVISIQVLGFDFFLFANCFWFNIFWWKKRNILQIKKSVFTVWKDGSYVQSKFSTLPSHFYFSGFIVEYIPVFMRTFQDHAVPEAYIHSIRNECPTLRNWCCIWHKWISQGLLAYISTQKLFQNEPNLHKIYALIWNPLSSEEAEFLAHTSYWLFWQWSRTGRFWLVCRNPRGNKEEEKKK